MSKVYCSIYNGIGNQLFGYSLGLYLARKYNRELVIDLTKLNLINLGVRTGLKQDTIRGYELDKIGFSEPVVQMSLFPIIKKIKWLHIRKKYVDFRKWHDESGVMNHDKDIHCLGWGDFSLVQVVIPEMREKFRPGFEFSNRLSAYRNIIQNHNSVAVHIRRTDYLDPVKAGFAAGLCTEKYYRDAIKYITENVENPFFVFFSDEPGYVKENYHMENSCTVEGNTGYEDLYLMSICNHFILANSTFSFWAAMLNNKTDKTVCVPKHWYNAPLRQAPFIPEGWMQLAVN